jgi:hypothetical protein
VSRTGTLYFRLLPLVFSFVGIFKGILPELEPVWNLSKSHCTYCWSDENIHMRNVDADIKKAIKIL